MSEIRFACPHCGQHIAGEEHYCGQEIRCPSCGGAIVIPEVQAAVPAVGGGSSGASANRQAATHGRGVPVSVCTCLFVFSWLPCLVAVFWERYRQWAMMRIAFRKAFMLGGETLPIPTPRTWDLQETAVRWASFGLCAITAYVFVAKHPQLSHRTLAKLGLVLCSLMAAWLFNQLPTMPNRRLESRFGRQVVLDTSGAPDAHVQPASISSPVATFRVQNPPQALTFVLDLRAPVETFYEQQRYFKFGVAKIFFDTDDGARTGQIDPMSGAAGFEMELDAVLMAQGHGRRALGDWANAALTVGNAKRHVIRCSLLRVQPPPGRMLQVDAYNMERGRAESRRILLTVRYNELGVVAGQSVRFAVLDQGACAQYGGGELLPSFRLVLK